ncbi:hypothetical protein NHQ30_006087 [Ciborinia camelliae]|nr:hypothetical protein NHQ30_006087 [Ciborinia camelliae]
MSTGLLPAPPGVTPDCNPWALSKTKVDFIIAYTSTFALASGTLGIRFYTRIAIMKYFGLDYRVKYGFGRHLWEVTAQQMGMYLTVSEQLSTSAQAL